MMIRFMHRAFAIAIAAVVLASCGSGDDTTTPPINEPPINHNPQPGRVYNYAGNGMPGYGPMGRTPERTQLYWPQDVVFSPVDGSAIVLDWNNHRVIQVNKATNHFKLLVGVADGDFGDPCPPSPQPCTGIDADNAKLNHPTHVAFDDNGNMVLCAWHNSELFLVNMQTGVMDRFCGTGQRPCYNGDDQTAVTACVDLPASVAFDPSGRLCFTDQANQIIRMVDENGMIHCIAGTAPVWDPVALRYNAQFGYAGDEGPATSALLSFERGQIADPSGKICFDQAGNMYIADTKNNCVRRVDSNGVIHLFAGYSSGGTPAAGFGGDGNLATDATVLLNGPRDVAADLDGNVYIADTGNNVVRMVTAADGKISSIGVQRPANSQPIAQTQLFKEDGALAANIHLTAPAGVEADSQGRVWIADTENNVIRVLYR
jgi:hypothetical protein